jgi:single-stranded DNA-specific DHH superfamily exonuclease
MDFYVALRERGLQDILRPVEYKMSQYHNFPAVANFLDELTVNPHKRCLIYGDYDLDGLVFILETLGIMKTISFDNYEVFRYRQRTHELDREAVRYCIQNRFDYFIIGDTGSSALETLRELTNYGVKVLVIDHHVPDYNYEDYPENVAIINTVLENRICEENRYEYSAGALAYTIYDTFAKTRGYSFEQGYCAYALISLYADCMNMANALNRAIYYRARELEREELPPFILHFMNEYQSFNKRFIGFWYAPRINALFRSESFDILNKYFFDESLDAIQRSTLIASINSIYEDCRDKTKLLVDLVDVTEYNHFVFSDLATAESKHHHLVRKAENYTGLVANKLSERYNKTAIVVCESTKYYKGSLRDLYSRAYLPLFKRICFAAGHNAAFGLKINLLELNSFLNKLERIDTLFSIENIANEPIIVEHEYANPDPSLIEDIALYNEFSGSTIPVAYISKRLVGYMPYERNSYYEKYGWGDTYFIQSDYKIDFGTKMIIQPIRSGRTKLLYQG